MRTTKIVLISIGLLATVALVAYLGFNFGKTQGYNTGYTIGNDLGYAKGVPVGYTSGYANGTQIGYTNGYSIGNTAGYGIGYTAGNTDGYTTGYQTGNQIRETTGYASGLVVGNQTGYGLGEKTGYTIGYQKGWTTTGFNIKDPTYQEMLTFIRNDKTDQKNYIDGSYVCHDFTIDVKRNAFNAGYRCFFVYIEMGKYTVDPSAHALVAFNTTDRGIVYIEPQTDMIMNVKVGQPYWDRTVYLAPSYDDTVTKIELVP